MPYSVALESISLDTYQKILGATDLVPSRMMLKDNLVSNFHSLKKQHIGNVKELRQALKTRDKLHDFAKQSGLTEEYLTILLREVNSIRRKPNRFKDFPAIPQRVIMSLEQQGIKNTRQLFDKVLTSEQRSDFAKLTGLSKQDILKLAKLTDLSRIRWVNHTFACVLYELGYDTAQKVANADEEILYEEVKKLNEARQLYKAHIGLHDMKLTVEAAKQVSQDIQYSKP